MPTGAVFRYHRVCEDNLLSYVQLWFQPVELVRGKAWVIIIFQMNSQLALEVVPLDLQKKTSAFIGHYCYFLFKTFAA